MINIRLLLIGMFCWIALLLAAGRVVELPFLGAVSPSFTLYVIAALTMGVLIVYPEMAAKSMQSTLFIVLGVFSAIKIMEHVGHVIDPVLVAMIALEMVMLAITVYIARKISSSLANTEKSIHSALLPWYPYAVLNEQDGESMITEELLRARRYERPLTLIHISVPRLRKKPLTRWSQQMLLEYEYVSLRIIQIIRDTVYDSDIIAWHNNNLVICLPETKPEEARVLAFPLESLLKTALPDGAKVSMAHFPADALVYKDLLHAALAAPSIQAPFAATVVERMWQPDNISSDDQQPQENDDMEAAKLWPLRQSAS